MLGEKAVIAALKRYKNYCKPAFIVHSYKYNLAQGEAGNIKWDHGHFKFYGDYGVDEIDVVFTTSRKIFLIEVKTYRRDNIKLTNYWEFKNNSPVDKAVTTQTEKHCRQFYHTFYDVIPDGNPKYIIPIVCFVDRCKIFDTRDYEYKEYIPVCTINNLNKLISVLDAPSKYSIDTEVLLSEMKKRKDSIEGIII